MSDFFAFAPVTLRAALAAAACGGDAMTAVIPHCQVAGSQQMTPLLVHLRKFKANLTSCSDRTIFLLCLLFVWFLLVF